MGLKVYECGHVEAVLARKGKRLYAISGILNDQRHPACHK
jgi:hypothetical protein